MISSFGVTVGFVSIGNVLVSIDDDAVGFVSSFVKSGSRSTVMLLPSQALVKFWSRSSTLMLVSSRLVKSLSQSTTLLLASSSQVLVKSCLDW